MRAARWAGWPSGAGSPRFFQVVGGQVGCVVQVSMRCPVAVHRSVKSSAQPPAFGQVEGEAAGSGGDPGRNVDQVAADGAGPRLGVEGGGEVAARASEVVGGGIPGQRAPLLISSSTDRLSRGGSRIRPSCNDPDCREDGVIGGWCPGHAIARYRRFAVRSTPARFLSGRARRSTEDEE